MTKWIKVGEMLKEGNGARKECMRCLESVVFEKQEHGKNTLLERKESFYRVFFHSLVQRK